MAIQSLTILPTSKIFKKILTRFKLIDFKLIYLFRFQDSASIMDRELNTESPTADVIQSSMDQLPFRYYQREASSFVFQGLAPYFSFQSLASFYSSLLRLTTTVVTTSTSTVTATVTSLSTTATSRFTISGCSPASLFYSTCNLIQLQIIDKIITL